MRMYMKKTVEDGFILSAINKYQTNLFVHPQLLFKELLPIASPSHVADTCKKVRFSWKAFYKGPL